MLLNKKNTKQKNWRRRKSKILVSVCTLFALTLTPVANVVIPLVNHSVYAENENYEGKKVKN